MSLADQLRSLMEAGRRNSGADQTLVQTIHDTAGMLGADCGSATEAQRENRWQSQIATLVEALSFDERSTSVRAALKTLYPNDWVWIAEMYPAECVYQVETRGTDGGRYYRRAYSIDEGTSAVTLGEAVEVRRVVTWQPLAQAVTETGTDIAGDLVPLAEAAVREDGTARVKVIGPGWGASGYYPADMLKRDGPAVFGAGTHMYWDHPTATEAAERPERSLRDLAGTLTTAATWDESGPAGPGLYADARVAAPYQDAVRDLAQDIGVSIRGQGRVTEGEAEGRRGPVIQQLTRGLSVDFVTVPGAGGRVLELFESARTHAAPTPIQEDAMSAEQIRALNEALDAERTERAALQERLARTEEALRLTEATRLATETLAAVQMPEPTRQRLIATLSGRPSLTEAGTIDRTAFATACQEAARQELVYLAETAGYRPGGVTGLGTPAPDATPEATSARMTNAFARLGLSESAARVAAAGRA